VLSAGDRCEEAVHHPPLGILRISAKAGGVPCLNFRRRVGGALAHVQLVHQATQAEIVPADEGDEFTLAGMRRPSWVK
jgi:hypothetical protein